MPDHEKNYKFRQAGLLDIPFVFNLIQDGSLSGSFTEFYLTSKGYFAVLGFLLLDVLGPHRFFKQGAGKVKLLIFMLGNEDIGFMKIRHQLSDGHGKNAATNKETRHARFPHSSSLPGGERDRVSLREFHVNVLTQVIELCAIAPDHRNHNHGSQMIQMYLDSLSTGTEVIAHCTKYSRAMQHIFKSFKFRRDKKTNNFHLECYRLIKDPQTLNAHHQANCAPTKIGSSGI